ncbi:hypothetical protein L6164_016592 [Bauhinia variegata]|uniref:Uncharacterized protein n=1 Tax=Bauhinia variegata TaxID=167791 RepID=A0ACB9NP55_BAUVA|nr:hypothetical protein L6164_016592 [Bauhinia variegata]
MELRLQLQTTKKSTMSMWEFILKIRHICDNLRAIGEKVSDDDQIMAILGGLGPEYNPIVVSISFESLSIELLQSHLLMYESRLERQKQADDVMLVRVEQVRSNPKSSPSNLTVPSGSFSGSFGQQCRPK